MEKLTDIELMSIEATDPMPRSFANDAGAVLIQVEVVCVCVFLCVSLNAYMHTCVSLYICWCVCVYMHVGWGEGGMPPEYMNV